MFEFGGQLFIAHLLTLAFAGPDFQGMGPGHIQEPIFSKSEPTFTHANLHQPLKSENLPAKFKHPILCDETTSFYDGL